ncbi:RNA-binding S4 domain-containing protein [Martelella radicis]|uniref:Ribosome-associated heat shock protein Hsp15 n=1 Tax=Martelella radicis TaxID=1397476 RepID=A0A7W6KGW1_9HYPH|nr:RNA-binding S4 domain-containing protein [Martelella radicis]MBB4121006.1 ribosome-associated heat shock protein Hsp15 [Martelella radicis]
MAEGEAAERQRVDKWLFFARIVKSRSLAQKLVRDGQVKLNGARIVRPSVDVSPGDRLVVALERRDVHLVVRAPGHRRGPYSEAQELYEDVSPPPEAREKLTAFEQAQRVPGAGRPTKKERRSLMRMRGEE